MNRSCARPQCRSAAAAALTYAYAQSTVWLQDLGDEPHPMVHDLCGTHAESLAVPRGWVLKDLRTTSATRSEAPHLLSA